MTNEQIAVVLALARCGMAVEAPSAAYLQQMRRLVKVLPKEASDKVQAMLDWHANGRKTTDQALVTR